MTSIYFNADAPDSSTSPHFDDDSPPAPVARRPPPSRGRRLALQGVLVTLAFMLVFSALAMLVVCQVGYSPRLLVGMLATFVIMAALAWRAGRFR